MNGTQSKLRHIQDILASVCTGWLLLRAAASGTENI